MQGGCRTASLVRFASSTDEALIDTRTRGGQCPPPSRFQVRSTRMQCVTCVAESKIFSTKCCTKAGRFENVHGVNVRVSVGIPDAVAETQKTESKAC